MSALTPRQKYEAQILKIREETDNLDIGYGWQKHFFHVLRFRIRAAIDHHLSNMRTASYAEKKLMQHQIESVFRDKMSEWYDIRAVTRIGAEDYPKIVLERDTAIRSQRNTERFLYASLAVNLLLCILIFAAMFYPSTLVSSATKFPSQEAIERIDKLAYAFRRSEAAKKDSQP